MNESKWIRFEDRHPEEGELFWSYCKGFALSVHRYFNGWIDTQATHWLPVDEPEPPKETENKYV